MKRTTVLLALLLSVSLGAVCQAAQLRVVTTLPDYAAIVEEIGGDRVSVSAIVSRNKSPARRCTGAFGDWWNSITGG